MAEFLAILHKQIKVIGNILVFLPFYFNAKTHFGYLFSPYKRLIGVRQEKGFALGDWLNELSMNLVSRGIGVVMRSLVLILFVLSYIGYLLIIAPIWLLLALFVSPFIYLWQQIFPPVKARAKLKQEFISNHLLDNQNLALVEDWYKKYQEQQAQIQDVFSLDNLLKTRPIGQDWHYGFTPFLDDYSFELTSPLTFKNILLDREEEIKMIEQALGKSQDANVILVGVEGVGKHTIIDGLAQNISDGKTTPVLQNYRIIELNVEKILAQKNSYEAKVAYLEELLLEASHAKNIIIVISDFHKYVSGSLVGDFASIWVKYCEKPHIRFITLTTPFFYEQIIYHHEKLRSAFSKINVVEPNKKKALEILLAKALFFENYYKVIISYEAIVQVINRVEYYVTHIPFPEKAINLLDEVCVYKQDLKTPGPITPELVDEVLRQKTNLPVGKLGPHLKHKLLNLEIMLSQNIFGQSRALSSIGKAIRRSYIEERKKKPLVSLLFLGPTGVGKTETAKQLAKIFFNSSKNLLRFDMSFYQNKENLTDLIGSFEEKIPGLLANAIRQQPYSVLLIDEVEKANKDVLNIFLTLLDEGYIIDGFGERVDCKNLIVIFTSNAASSEIIGWLNQSSINDLETKVRDYVINNAIFSPEFLNRFDKILVFEPIGLKTAYEIGYKIAKVASNEYLQQQNIKLKISAAQLREWIEQAYKIENGAREINRVVRENLANLISDKLLT